MKKRPHILLLFLDGVGIGKKNMQHNPFLKAKLPTLKKLLEDRIPTLRDAYRESAMISFKPINATLGISGLPQSGTGQAALLTGINAPHIVGKHFGPHLYSSLKPIVAENNIFVRLRLAGEKVFYANAFPRQYFEYLQSHQYRSTALVHAWLATDNILNDSSCLMVSNALSADITNERWHKLGYSNLPIISPQEAGRRLVHFTYEYDFVLFEYFFTDHAGHSQSMKEAVEVLEKLDGLIGGILDSLDYEKMIFILTSDHGNIEDLSVKCHTRNPVPLMAVGKQHREITRRVSDLTHITPSILKLLT